MGVRATVPSIQVWSEKMSVAAQTAPLAVMVQKFEFGFRFAKTCGRIVFSVFGKLIVLCTPWWREHGENCVDGALESAEYCCALPEFHLCFGQRCACLRRAPLQLLVCLLFESLVQYWSIFIDALGRRRSQFIDKCNSPLSLMNGNWRRTRHHNPDDLRYSCRRVNSLQTTRRCLGISWPSSNRHDLSAWIRLCCRYFLMWGMYVYSCTHHLTVYARVTISTLLASKMRKKMEVQCYSIQIFNWIKKTILAVCIEWALMPHSLLLLMFYLLLCYGFIDIWCCYAIEVFCIGLVVV